MNGGVRRVRYYTHIHRGSHGQLVRETWSEAQVLAAHFKEWAFKCLNAGVDEALITANECLEDWVTVNWALETDANGKPVTRPGTG